MLVRHGQTDANEHGIVQGHQPTALNALGREQADLVARRLAAFEPRIDLIVSSDLPRATQTATPLAELLGLDIHCDRSWRERCYGTFEGKNPQERAALRHHLNLGPGDPPPGAQSEAEYQREIGEALLRLPRQFPQARCIAVITHGGACRAVAMMLADGRLPAAPGNPVPEAFNCPNAAVTHLVLGIADSGPRYRYECVFDISHLEPAVITVRDSG